MLFIGCEIIRTTQQFDSRFANRRNETSRGVTSKLHPVQSASRHGGSKELRQDSTQVRVGDERAGEGGSTRDAATSRPTTSRSRSRQTRGRGEHSLPGDQGLDRTIQGDGSGKISEVILLLQIKEQYSSHFLNI
jgi:hypothetical protein